MGLGLVVEGVVVEGVVVEGLVVESLVAVEREARRRREVDLNPETKYNHECELSSWLKR